jgi:glycosyltransferase involved in cell wall biosynthesis
MVTANLQLQAPEARVSVGLPTYNRCLQLRRAIESVLNQTHTNIELVISDNASTDDTQSVCEEYARRDSRVRYIRQPKNIGMIPNFNSVLRESASPYFMWLSDDDWLDERYVELCISVLRQHADYALVAGVNRYYIGDSHVFDCEVVQLTEDDPCKRVLKLYHTSLHAGYIYALIRREHIQHGFGDPPIMWDDLYLTATLVFAGKAEMLETTCVHRARTGASATIDGAMALYGVKTRSVYLLDYYRGINAAREVLRNPAYRVLPVIRRLAFALQTFRFACFRVVRAHPFRDAFAHVHSRARNTYLWRSLRAVVRR